MSAKILYTQDFNDALESILHYISYTLKAEKAAERLLNEIIQKSSLICETPEAYPVYKPKFKKFPTKLRHYSVKNYTIFYTYDKKENIVKAIDIIYSRRNISKLL